MLSKKDEKSLTELNCFIIRCYAMNWFTAHNYEMTPLSDIFRKLHEYIKINKTIAEATIEKCVNYLYYLNVEYETFALFVQRIYSKTKRLIC